MARPRNDISGQTFGQLTAIRRLELPEANGHYKWICECASCGKTVLVWQFQLTATKRRDQTCGCGVEAYRQKVAVEGFNKPGEKRGKLDQQKADQIRALSPQPTLQELATQFGVSKAAIRNVLQGNTWTGQPRAPKRGKLGIMEGHEDLAPGLWDKKMKALNNNRRRKKNAESKTT